MSENTKITHNDIPDLLIKFLDKLESENPHLDKDYINALRESISSSIYDHETSSFGVHRGFRINDDIDGSSFISGLILNLDTKNTD